MQNEQHFFIGEPQEQEIFFLDTLPLIRRFTVARLRGLCRYQAEDLVQCVALNLWRWYTRKADLSKSDLLKALPEGLSKGSSKKINQSSGGKITNIRKVENQETDEQNNLTSEEWLRLANTVTHNEINSFYRSKYRRETQLAETPHEKSASDETSYNPSLTCPATVQIEGNSRTEVASLLNQVWQIIETFPTSRKYSYLLGKEELIINLIAHGTVTRKRFAEALDLAVTEFDIIIKNLPLADEQIGNLVEMKTGTQATVRQIWTWRAKAKKQLAEKLKDKI